MTTRSLILSPHEVRAALAGTLGLVVRPATGLGGTRAEDQIKKCPLGVPGDRLRCKERVHHHGGYHDARPGHENDNYVAIEYDVDKLEVRIPCTYETGHVADRYSLKTIPAQHMPAWASRITLEVVGVRCVRVQELTEQEVRLAGDLDDLEPADVCATAKRHDLAMDDGRARFACAWNAKYSKRGLGWEINPWAWAVEVRRVD